MDITPTDRKSKIVWNMKIFLQKKKKRYRNNRNPFLNRIITVMRNKYESYIT